MDVLGFAILAFGIAAVTVHWTLGRSRAILDGWAEENGFRVEVADYRWFRRGPFFWRSSKGQSVYYVTVVDQDGRRRRGWVRCGSFWFGIFRAEADVEWDDRETDGR